MTRHYLDILADTIRQNWDAPALTDYAVLDGGDGNSYTYGEMYCKMQWLMECFRQLGIQPGDHIALCGANSAHWAIAYLTIAAYHGVSVSILHTQIPEEMVRQIDFADASTLIIDADIWQTLDTSLLPQVKYVLSLTDFSSLIGNPGADTITSPSVASDVAFDTQDLDTLAQICFTSGSTERPKGVMLSYRNISNNVFDATSTLPVAHRQSFVSMLPFSHTYGIMGELLSQLPNAHHIYILGNLFSAEILVTAFNRLHPYAVVTVPQIIERLYRTCGCKLKYVLGQQLQQLLVGGSHLDDAIEDSLLDMQIPLTVGYGLTETAPLLGANLWQNYVPHSGGHIVPGMEAKISPAGEILVRGENVMLGYYKDPEATASKIDADGWLHTGDAGHLDEGGNLYVHGRLQQDMIVLPSGENISPAKVEAIINACDGVEESIVIARNGKLVALVVLNHELPSLLGEGQGVRLRNRLLAQINPQLPAYSQLFGIEFLSEPLARTEKKTLKRYLYK